MNKAVCVVYRTFLRYARELQAGGEVLNIREPMDKGAWRAAKHSWIVNDPGARLCFFSPLRCTWDS